MPLKGIVFPEFLETAEKWAFREQGEKGNRSVLKKIATRVIGREVTVHEFERILARVMALHEGN